MTTLANRDGIADLLRSVAALRSARFTGLGVIFYQDLKMLSYAPLEVHQRESIPMPIVGIEQIASMLVGFSEVDSPWHDGFHFIELATMSLTHLAQFISPPIPPVASLLPKAKGARQMAAALACSVEGILAVGLVSRTGEPSIYPHIHLSGA